MAFQPTRVALSKSQPPSSRAWLARQFKDPYVRQRMSHPAAYRSRSAFKLLELNEKWDGFLHKDDVHAVVDLGAAPGGWSQVVAGKLGWADHDALHETPMNAHTRGNSRRNDRPGDVRWSSGPEDADEVPNIAREVLPQGRGTIVAVDLLDILPYPGVTTLKLNFLSPRAGPIIKGILESEKNPEGKADIILSDMAANVTGNRTHDIESSLIICEAVFEFTRQNLRSAESIGRRRGGVLLLKHFTHPLLQDFRIHNLDPNFHDVKFIKPDASRAASSEGYWLCQGWRGDMNFFG